MSDMNTASAHFSNYQEYNKTLRTWFVTFGLGAPAMFLVNHDLGTALKTSGATPWVVGFYLSGCFVQVAIALLNKFVAWNAYDAVANPKEWRAFRRHCQALENEFRIDMAADVLTAAAFIIATAIVFFTFAF